MFYLIENLVKFYLILFLLDLNSLDLILFLFELNLILICIQEKLFVELFIIDSVKWFTTIFYNMLKWIYIVVNDENVFIQFLKYANIFC